MARLTTSDKQILEKLFQMGGGYVLNFSGRTMAEFFRDDVGVDIYNLKYNYASGSKANRMRGLWLTADDKIVGNSILKLLEYIENQIWLDTLKRSDFPTDRINVAKAIAENLLGTKIRVKSYGVSSQKDLSKLLTELIKLEKLAPQERGYAFEKFLTSLFIACDLNPRTPFRLTGEQIDGSIDLDGNTYLIEAKWQNIPASNADLLVFHGKVGGKASWSRGIFISYAGFSQDGLEAFSRGRSTNLIALDGLDLSYVLEGRISLVELIQLKTRCAAEEGKIMVSACELV